MTLTLAILAYFAVIGLLLRFFDIIPEGESFGSQAGQLGNNPAPGQMVNHASFHKAGDTL